MKTHFPIHRTQRGFALIATVSVMVLLVLVTLALMGLSTIELRSSRNQSAQDEAKANARMAMMIALGELQKAVGPDQRISANASVLDTHPSSEEVDGLQSGASSQLLGVWDSWNTWVNDEMNTPSGSKLRIQSTYQSGRHPDIFRKWLVSHNTPSLLEKWNAPLSAGGNLNLTGTDSVEVLGKGSLGIGSSVTNDQFVRAGLVETIDNGRFAWWVGGEAQKAATQLSKPNLNGSDEIRMAMDSTSRNAPETLQDLEGLSTDQDDLSKQITFPTLELAAGIDRNQAGRYLPHLTPYSRSVIADVRWGGLKKDLSLLFEKSELPDGFKQINNMEPSVRPISSDLKSHNPKRPERTLFSWEQMHEFYRIYRDDTKDINPEAPLKFAGQKPYTYPWVYLQSNGRATFNEQGYARHLVLLKFYANIGLQTVQRTASTYDCYITYTPIITIWNPYNVEMRLKADQLNVMSLLYKICPLAYRAYRGNNPVTGWQTISQDYSQYGFSGDWGSLFRQAPGSRDEMIISPGEIVTFSHHHARNWNLGRVDLVYEGFKPESISRYRAKVRGLENVSAGHNPGLALRFHSRWSRDDYTSWWGGNPGSFVVRMGTPFVAYGQHNTGEFSLPLAHNVDFFENGQDFTQIIPDNPSSLARFEFSDTEPVIAASVGLVAKTASLPSYDNHIGWRKDWRCKNWLHASPAFWGNQMMNPSDRARAAHPFLVHFQQVTGGAGISEIVPHIGRNGFLGGGESDAERVMRAPILELPTAPISSLAGFAALRLTPGWWNSQPLDRGGHQAPHAFWEGRRMGYQSGVPGIGIGNSFADPMINGNQIYQYHDNSRHQNGVRTEGFSDFWDHGLLANDALWDSYFLSSMASEPSYYGNSRNSAKVVQEFYEDGKPLPNRRLQPWIKGTTASEAISSLKSADGWKKSAAHLMLDGGFNINSTSVEAWKAFFHGLVDRPVYRRSDGSLAELNPPTGTAAITRFHIPLADKESPDPRNGVDIDGKPSWSGVRFLTNDQLDLLAEKCVEQVKLRGPFLNMSEFVNRRLSTDELGVRGALQAAIDYDDSAPDSKSINYRYKQGTDQITLSDVTPFAYPFANAAVGSRFTAIPGYVVQSDLLQALGNSMTVRDDTFRIRAYGDARDQNGNITARAWCEAVVQRTPHYVDRSDDDEEASMVLNGAGIPVPNADLSTINTKYGRRLKIITFRWLNPDEV